MMSARPKTLPEIPMGAVLSAAATVVVIGAIVSGLMVIDGPEVERRLRLDKTRVLDLERIASAIDCYWTLNGRLPTDLASLTRQMDEEAAKRPIPNFCKTRSIVDPVTKEPYRYRIVEDASFELCAVFAEPLSDEREAPVSGYGLVNRRSWVHEAGQYCFRPAAFTLDSTKLPR